MSNEKNVVTEEQLGDVSGGLVEAKGNCYFLPADVFEKKIYDGATWIKCKSNCYGFAGANCSCHGTPRCSGKFHRVEEHTGASWGPFPKGENNHGAGDKLFAMK